MRILYRARQFWHAVSAIPAAEELAIARNVLSPPLLALFTGLHPSEQAHSLRILRQLLQKGETHYDLMVAALLHDVGKSRHPLRLWDRVAIVLSKALFPERAKRWGQGPARGWRRPFAIAERHPAWGAEMAARAGASPLAVALIYRHQEPPPANPVTLEDHLLYRLRLLDDES